VRRAVVALAGMLALWASAPASAGIDYTDPVYGSLDATMRPATLPREQQAAVAVGVDGSFWVASRNPSQLPQLRRIEVAINSGGQIFDRGLAVCREKQIQPATEPAARRICGDARVGSGSVDVQIRIPDQLPYMVHARLLAFNGPKRNGHRLILAQAYVGEPVTSFIIEFEVHHEPGNFGTVLTSTLPRAARQWGWLTRFQLSLHRSFTYLGQRRAYVSAACSAPAGFGGGPFTFAKATYTFAGGTRVTPNAQSSCRVKKE
jgi:hypothetical protein